MLPGFKIGRKRASVSVVVCSAAASMSELGHELSRRSPVGVADPHPIKDTKAECGCDRSFSPKPKRRDVRNLAAIRWKADMRRTLPEDRV